MNVETHKFFDFITCKNTNKCFYLALICRPKYLSVEERRNLKANMLSLKLYKHKNKYDPYLDYEKYILRFVASGSTYLNKQGKSIPAEALAIYGGINPVNIVSSVSAFKKDLVSLEEKCIENNLPFDDYYSTVPRMLDKQYTKYPLRKTCVDIDVDVIFDKATFNHMLEDMKEHASKEQLEDLLFVFTRGGFHILSRKEHMDREWNTKVILNITYNRFCTIAKEVVINKNNMCPIPGTKQCNYDVHCSTFSEVYNECGN